MLSLALADEPPSAMVQQAYSIPYDAYQVELWQHLMIGTVCGAMIALAVVFALLASGPQKTPYIGGRFGLT